MFGDAANSIPSPRNVGKPPIPHLPPHLEGGPCPIDLICQSIRLPAAPAEAIIVAAAHLSKNIFTEAIVAAAAPLSKNMLNEEVEKLRIDPQSA